MATLTTPQCLFCGKTSVLEVTEAQLAARADGAKAQDVFPDPEYSADFREQAISGTHAECWPFSDDDDDDDEES